MALFALKLMPVGHAEKAKGNHHLRVEREMLERADATSSPFLCVLKYAFVAGPWLVLALPLLSGGTLQLHLDERGAHGLGGPLLQAWCIAAGKGGGTVAAVGLEHAELA